MDKASIYNNKFIPFIKKAGVLTGIAGVAVSFFPALVLYMVYNLLPPTTAIMTAFVSIASAVGALWFVEPISYFPVVGIAGTYMAFLSGNISNMRIPCAAVAQASADVQPGTEEGSIIATLGMAVSIVINILILTLGVMLGSAILSQLPPGVRETLNYLLPALFGALFVQFAWNQVHMAPVCGIVGIVLNLPETMALFSWLPGARNYLPMLGTVFISIAVGIMFYKAKNKKEQA